MISTLKAPNLTLAFGSEFKTLSSCLCIVINTKGLTVFKILDVESYFGSTELSALHFHELVKLFFPWQCSKSFLLK